MSTQSIPPPSTNDDAAAFHGHLHITNPWYSLDLDSFQLLAGVHVPAHFAARLPASTIGQASTTPSALLYGSTGGSHSPPRGASVRLCRDDPNCTREDCYFAHTNKATMAPSGRCSYGSRCTRNGCTLSHDDDEESISPTSSPSFKSLVSASTLSVHAPVFELNDDVFSPPASTGRYPKSNKALSNNYYDDATTNVSGTGAGVVSSSSSGYWSNGRRTSPTSTPTSRSPTRSTSPTSLATIPRPVNVTPMRRVNATGSSAPTMGGRSDTANAWTTVRRHRNHSNGGQGQSPSRSRGHWHQQHSNTMVSVSA